MNRIAMYPDAYREVQTIPHPTTNVLFTLLMRNSSVEVSRLIPYLVKHNQVRRFITVIFLVRTISVCLASLRLDPASVEPESQQHLGNQHASLHSLSPVLHLFKSLQRETHRQKRGKWK